MVMVFPTATTAITTTETAMACPTAMTATVTETAFPIGTTAARTTPTAIERLND